MVHGLHLHTALFYPVATQKRFLQILPRIHAHIHTPTALLTV